MKALLGYLCELGLLTIHGNTALLVEHIDYECVTLTLLGHSCLLKE